MKTYKSKIFAAIHETAQDFFAILAAGWAVLHYSYAVVPPIPTRRLGLTARRLAWTPLNFPPASVWQFSPVGG